MRDFLIKKVENIIPVNGKVASINLYNYIKMGGSLDLLDVESIQPIKGFGDYGDIINITFSFETMFNQLYVDVVFEDGDTFTLNASIIQLEVYFELSNIYKHEVPNCNQINSLVLP